MAGPALNAGTPGRCVVTVRIYAALPHDLGGKHRPSAHLPDRSTHRRPGPDGVPVPAATLQSASLAGIADLFALVVGKSDDIPG
jgi:hypothetical protein